MKSKTFKEVLELAKELDMKLGECYLNRELDEIVDDWNKVLAFLESIPTDDVYWEDL
jgi:sugar phosphate isomerase/epimerase